MYLFKIAPVGWVSKLLNSGRVACPYTAVASLFQRVALPSILFLLVCSWTESHPLTLRQRFAAVYPRRWCKPPEDYREPASCRLHKERAKRKGVLHTIEPKLGSKCAQIASLDHDKKVKRSSSKCQRSRPEYLCWFWGGFVHFVRHHVFFVTKALHNKRKKRSVVTRQDEMCCKLHLDVKMQCCPRLVVGCL